MFLEFVNLMRLVILQPGSTLRVEVLKNGQAKGVFLSSFCQCTYSQADFFLLKFGYL